MDEHPKTTLLLVNSDHPLPDDYAPDLVEIEGYPETYCDRRCEQAIVRFLAAAAEAGFHATIVSAYRDRKQQQGLLGRKVELCWTEGTTLADALAKATRIAALPGSSEHETGLAFDVRSDDYQDRTAPLESAPGQAWLASHCHEFGFVLRYPPDKEHTTHVIFEPCHFRYVGKGHAAEMVGRGLTLEEYVDFLERRPISACHDERQRKPQP